MLCRLRFLGAAALLLAGAATAAAPPTSIHLVTRVTRDSSTWRSLLGRPFVATTETWIKSGRVRQQDQVVGARRVRGSQSVRIWANGRRYVFAAANPGRTLLSRPLPRAQRSATTAGRVRDLFGKGAPTKRVGRANLLGHQAGIYEPLRPRRGVTLRWWIAEDVGVPVPLRTLSIANGVTTVQDTLLLEVNPRLPDRLFTPPPARRK